MFHTSTGKLRYSQNWLLLEVNQDVADYYLKLIPKYKNVNRPRWEAHISVVNPKIEIVVDRSAWGKYEGAEIEYLYEDKIQCGEIYYWLNCSSKKLEEIRAELGLPKVTPSPLDMFPDYFHITIGNTKS